VGAERSDSRGAGSPASEINVKERRVAGEESERTFQCLVFGFQSGTWGKWEDLRGGAEDEDSLTEARRPRGEGTGLPMSPLSKGLALRDVLLQR